MKKSIKREQSELVCYAERENYCQKGRTMLMAAAAFILMMTTTVLTSCTDDDDNSAIENEQELVVTDNKPFPYDDEIDENMRPGDDFYRYALGKWLDSSNPAPSYFQEIANNNKALLTKTLTTSNDPLLVELRGLVDEAMADDSRSAALLNERLQMLEQVKTADQMDEAFAKLHELGYSPLFRLTPMPTDGRKVLNAMITGAKTVDMDTVMGKRETDKLPEKVASYCKLLNKFGFSDSRIAQISENATKVEMLEFEIFASTINMEFLNRPLPLFSTTRGGEDETLNAVIKLAELMGINPDFVEKKRIAPATRLSLNLAMQFAKVSEQPELVPLFRDYMLYNVISQDSYCVPKLSGETSQFAILNNALHYSKYYKFRIMTEAYGYGNIYKQKCKEIMEKMRQVFINRLGKLEWMSEATKAEARHKAEAMEFFIGYPEKWNDEMTPQADADCLLAAVTKIRQHSVETSKKMIDGDINVMGWDFWLTNSSFTTDNAFYARASNALVIMPSWITRPRFNEDLNEAIIYAASTCFAHELCHGFDADGSKYDANGNPNEWWDASDRKAFEAKQDILVELFNQLDEYPGHKTDGRHTLNENMADYGGMEITLECYKNHLIEQGFKGEQFDLQIKRFFLAYAQLWKIEDERSLESIKKASDKEDVHSLNHVRVNGMMRLQDDWYRLFDVKPTENLYLDQKDRVKIW